MLKVRVCGGYSPPSRAAWTYCWLRTTAAGGPIHSRWPSGRGRNWSSSARASHAPALHSMPTARRKFPCLPPTNTVLLRSAWTPQVSAFKHFAEPADRDGRRLLACPVTFHEGQAACRDVLLAREHLAPDTRG